MNALWIRDLGLNELRKTRSELAFELAKLRENSGSAKEIKKLQKKLNEITESIEYLILTDNT